MYFVLMVEEAGRPQGTWEVEQSPSNTFIKFNQVVFALNLSKTSCIFIFWKNSMKKIKSQKFFNRSSSFAFEVLYLRLLKAKHLKKQHETVRSLPGFIGLKRMGKCLEYQF
jgi:hypothetical protein